MAEAKKKTEEPKIEKAYRVLQECTVGNGARKYVGDVVYDSDIPGDARPEHIYQPI